MKLRFNTLPTAFRADHRSFDFLSFLVLTGVLTGALFGSFAILPELQISLSDDVSTATFAGSFGGAAFFLVLLLLASTSLWGVVLVPVLLVVKAYCMSCSIAAFYASGGFDGLLQAFFAVGIPSVLFLPAFFLCAQHAMCASGRLCALRFRASTYEKLSFSPLKTFFYTSLSLILYALYDHVLMPMALTGIF